MSARSGDAVTDLLDVSKSARLNSCCQWWRSSLDVGEICGTEFMLSMVEELAGCWQIVGCPRDLLDVCWMSVREQREEREYREG